MPHTCALDRVGLACSRVLLHDWSGAPGRIRTVDLVLRRHTLYPSELRAQSEIRLSAMIVLRSVVGSQWKGKGENRKWKIQTGS